MVLLFVFEFIEGNTITRLYFMRLRRLAREALAAGRVTPVLARARREQLVVHAFPGHSDPCCDRVPRSAAAEQLDTISYRDNDRGRRSCGAELYDPTYLSLGWRRGIGLTCTGGGRLESQPITMSSKLRERMLDASLSLSATPTREEPASNIVPFRRRCPNVPPAHASSTST